MVCKDQHRVGNVVCPKIGLGPQGCLPGWARSPARRGKKHRFLQLKAVSAFRLQSKGSVGDPGPPGLRDRSGRWRQEGERPRAGACAGSTLVRSRCRDSGVAGPGTSPRVLPLGDWLCLPCLSSALLRPMLAYSGLPWSCGKQEHTRKFP